MQLEHEFTVPAPIDEVWAAVIDPERVAPCMPGATLTSVEDTRFSGGVKVKIGPISLLYKGTGEFTETDEKTHTVVIKASGKDSRGNGTASASVTVTLTENGASTTGNVLTDLTITGKPAQFGRGMISEVGGKILDTFAGCLAGKLAAPEEPAAEPPPATDDTPAESPAVDSTPAAASKEAKSPAAEQPAATAKPAAAEKPALKVVNNTAPAKPAVEPIDLLDYAGPSVAKRLVPGIVALVIAVLIFRRLRRR